MRRLTCLSALVLLPALVSAQTEVVEIPAPSLRGARFENPSDLPILVHRPPGYDGSAERYPVVYYLPGFTTDVTEYVDGTFDGLDAGRLLDACFAETGDSFLLVVVHGRNVLGGSFYVDSPVTGNWERWVVHDVVAYVDAHYRTLPDAASRGLAGDSMGGCGALHVAMRHPERFGAVYAISPGLFDENGLRDQGMFARPGYVRAHLIQRERIQAWPRAERRARFLEFVGELYRKGGFAYRRAFAYAYGAAFAPAPESEVPWIDYPYDDADAPPDPRAIARYEAGYGDLRAKVAANEAGLRRLRGLVLRTGRNDPLTYVPNGCRFFSSLLDELQIAHQLEWDDRGHVGDMAGRWREGLVPSFQQTLARESP